MRRRGLAPRASTAGSRYEAKLGPPIFQTLADHWDVPEHLARSWWKALMQAEWSEAAGWRETLIAFHPARQDPRALVTDACPPATVVAVLELLVREHCLHRGTATKIEERLLSHVNAGGRWYRGPGEAWSR